MENPLCPEMWKNLRKERFSGEILIWAALNTFLHFFLFLAVKQKENKNKHLKSIQKQNKHQQRKTENK